LTVAKSFTRDFDAVDLTQSIGSQQLGPRADCHNRPFVEQRHPMRHVERRIPIVCPKHHARRAGVVLSTHDPDHAFAVAHRVALLHEGTIVTIGPPSDVLTADSLRQVYGIEVTIERLRNGQTICAPAYRA
jgi:hypothetical protein